MTLRKRALRIAGSPLHVDRDCRVDDTLVAPAGGWYTLQVRFRAAGRVTARASVAHVGVGEVFVIAGQSNSTNFGEVRQITRSRMVSTFDGARWRIADDPQPGVQDGSTQGSFIPAFGDALYARLKVPIAVACVGYGGTSVRQWLPRGDRFGSPPSSSEFFTAVAGNGGSPTAVCSMAWCSASANSVPAVFVRYCGTRAKPTLTSLKGMRFRARSMAA